MDINNYRIIRDQFLQRDSLIRSLKMQVRMLDKQEVYYDSALLQLRKQVLSFGGTISRKDSVIEDMEKSMDEMIEIKTTDPKRWYERPSTWISGVIGILLGFIISN